MRPGPSRPLDRPPGGIPALADSADAIADAAKRLRRGEGAVAIDTERAGAYRYDNRAFLLQIHRRGCGTVLIDPVGNEASIASYLAPVLNDLNWVLHAADTDLACLSWLGLEPGQLWCTHIAAQLAGRSRTGLAGLTEDVLGIELAKGMARSDWSVRPLRPAQLGYAALDVEFLLEVYEELRAELTQLGRLQWWEQECAAVAAAHHNAPPFQPSPWYRISGASTLASVHQQAALKGLWQVRDELARHQDRSPHRVLHTDIMIELARRLPSDSDLVRAFPELRAVPRPVLARMSAVIAQSQKMSVAEAREFVEADLQASGSTSADTEATVPHRSELNRNYPETIAVFQQFRDILAETAADYDLAPEVIATTRDLLTVAWWSRDLSPATSEEVALLLERRGLRPWQQQLLAEDFAEVLAHAAEPEG